MRDEKPDDRAIAAYELGDGWRRMLASEHTVQRQAGIEDQASAVMLELYAAAANLVRAAMDARAHPLTRPSEGTRREA